MLKNHALSVRAHTCTRKAFDETPPPPNKSFLAPKHFKDSSLELHLLSFQRSEMNGFGKRVLF